MIDNYDSFTYNLVQYIGTLGAEIAVRRNDKVTLEEIKALAPEKIVISPGPGYPDEAGISLDVIREFSGRLPILGVCLGHQSIGQAFGGKVVPAPELKHGKSSLVYHCGTGIYSGLDNPFEAGRYHSLVLDRESLPSCFMITAETKEGLIMGIRHREFPTEGVQFHPESILTPDGMNLIDNFLNSYVLEVS